ncbi:MAG: YaaR family protein [Treponema sp.]|nr:YaaR family protein [Treponema sp.]
MEKVDLNTISLLNPSLLGRSETKKTKEKEKVKTRFRFSELFEGALSAGELGPIKLLPPSEEALTQLMDDVHSCGSDLLDRPFPDEIIKYKRAVRNFVNYVVENGFTVEISRTPMTAKKNPKTYVQVRVIDQKLEEFAAGILSGQYKQLKLIAKLDEIHGLLVDLTITGVIRENDE